MKFNVSLDIDLNGSYNKIEARLGKAFFHANGHRMSYATREECVKDGEQPQYLAFNRIEWKSFNLHGTFFPFSGQIMVMFV